MLATLTGGTHVPPGLLVTGHSPPASDSPPSPPGVLMFAPAEWNPPQGMPLPWLALLQQCPLLRPHRPVGANSIVWWVEEATHGFSLWPGFGQGSKNPWVFFPGVTRISWTRSWAPLCCSALAFALGCCQSCCSLVPWLRFLCKKLLPV